MKNKVSLPLLLQHVYVLFIYLFNAKGYCPITRMIARQKRKWHTDKTLTSSRAVNCKCNCRRASELRCNFSMAPLLCIASRTRRMWTLPQQNIPNLQKSSDNWTNLQRWTKSQHPVNAEDDDKKIHRWFNTSKHKQTFPAMLEELVDAKRWNMLLFAAVDNKTCQPFLSRPLVVHVIVVEKHKGLGIRGSCCIYQ